LQLFPEVFLLFIIKRARLAFALVALIAAAFLLSGCLGGPAPAAGWSSPVVSNQVIYLGGVDGRVIAVNAGDGTLKWAFPDPTSNAAPLGAIYATPTISNGMLYVGSADHKLYALEAATGAKSGVCITGTDFCERNRC
jgi:outer membrane protein assembly factor BamB